MGEAMTPQVYIAKGALVRSFLARTELLIIATLATTAVVAGGNPQDDPNLLNPTKAQLPDWL